MKRLLHLFALWLLATTGTVAQTIGTSLSATVQVHPAGKLAEFSALTFVNGYVVTPRNLPGDNIAWQPGSSAVGAKDASHVNGYAEKNGTTAFTFPVGNGTVYRPAGMSAPAVSGIFQAAYFGSNASSATLPTGAPFSTASLGTGVTAVSAQEYWDINGPSAVNITLSWNTASGLTTLTGNTLANLAIVGWDGSKWVSLGGVATGTLSGNGSITTSTAIVPNAYTAYTFGSASSCATPTVGGVVANLGGNGTVCTLSNAGSLTLTGQTGNVARWETSTDGGTTWTALVNTAGNAYYTFVNAQNSQQYRAIVNNGAGCADATATAVTIAASSTACSSASCDRTAGTVSVGTVSQSTGPNLVNQLILTNAAGTIQYISAANSNSVTGAVAGQYLAYQITYNNTLTPTSTLTVGKNLSAVGGSCITYSNQLALQVCAACPNPSVGGTVAFAGTQPLCSTANSGMLTLSGQTGTVLRWETSTDGGTTWTAVANTNTTLNFTNVANNQQYRAIVNAGGSCADATSAPVTLTTSAAACSLVPNCDFAEAVITK